MVECVEQTLGLSKVPEVTLAYQSLDKQEARLMSTWPEKVTESPNHLDQDFPVSNLFRDRYCTREISICFFLLD